MTNSAPDPSNIIQDSQIAPTGSPQSLSIKLSAHADVLPKGSPSPPLSTPIQVIGIGLTGATGLTPDHHQRIAQADILVGSHRHLAYFPQHPAERWDLSNLQDLMAQLLTALQQPIPPNIVILTSGDPLFFGLGRLLLAKIPADALSFHPHLSSVQLAFSRLKLDWQDACIISIHGRAWERLITALKRGEKKIAVLADPQHSPTEIATLIDDLALPCSYQIWICENLDGPTERIRSFSTTALQQIPVGSEFPIEPLHILVLVRQDDPISDSLPIIGIADGHFASFPDRPGLMTKREIRIQILAELNLKPEQTIWDIGAGTGSVSIEMARLVPQTKIYAIEKTAIGISLIQQNCQRFGVTNLQVIQGVAPAVLAPLPAPDRVFVGGSSGHLQTLLTHISQCLKPSGQVVIALATLENIGQLNDWAQANPQWRLRLLQLNIARGVTVGKQHRFSPLNPVTVATLHPPK